MNLKTKLGVAALAMLALTATTASAADMATEPLPNVPVVDEEQARYAPKPPIEVEACAAAIPPLCGPGGNDAARLAYSILGFTDCVAVLAGGTVYQC